MRERGFSLVELLTVMGIMAVLLAIATLKFRDYQRRYGTERQTRRIYCELLQARSDALYQRKCTRVKLYRDHFEVYSSTTEGSRIAPALSVPLRYPVAVNGSGANVDFDEQGFTNNQRSICVDDGGLTGAVDSVVVAASRVSLGKKGDGGGCSSDNIAIK